MRHRIRQVALLIAYAGCAASFTLSLRAQSISGSVVGEVTDQRQAPISGVAVVATNIQTGLQYFSSGTNSNGYYRLLELPPGTYSVQAIGSATFRPAVHTNVAVGLDRETIENFSLELAPPKTLLQVHSSAPLIVTTGPTLSTSFSENQIRQLPILTRDTNNLALLAPGVFSVRTFSFASTLVPFAVNGSRGRDNDFIIDSVNNNEPLFGGAATQFTNTDIFADYTVLTSQPKAEFGRNTGATVNVITKSGSEKVHGSLFWFGQDDIFNAMTRVEKQALLTQPAAFYENVAGATLGGPLKERRDTFFFISYQADRARSNLSNVYPVIATLPTTEGLAALGGLNTNNRALQTLLDSPTVQSIPGAKAACFGPNTAGLPTMNPCYTGVTSVSASGGAAVQVPYGSYLVPDGNLFDVRDQQASARIDTRLNDSNDLYGRYLLDDLRTPQEVLSPTGEVAFSDLGQLPDSQTILQERTQSFLLDERYNASTWLNEARFSFNRIAQGIGQFSLPADTVATQPAATVADGGFGGFGSCASIASTTCYQGNFPSAGQQFTVGNDTSPTEIHSNIFEAQDNISFSHGRSTLKAGVDVVRTESNILSIPGDLGHYFFGELGVIGGLNCFVNEGVALTSDSQCPNVASGTTNALAVFERFPDVKVNSQGVVVGQGRNELPLRNLSGAGFLQNDFQLRPNFTLSLGVRYEWFGQPINTIHDLNKQVSTVANDANNVSPRFGFAWAPRSSSTTVIRGGYALLYDPMPLNIPLLIWQSGPVSPLISTLTSVGANLSASPPPLINTSGLYPSAPLTLSNLENAQGVSGCSTFTERNTTGSVPLINCSSQDAVDPKLVNPYIQSYSLGFQRALSTNVLLEVDYVGSRGTKLYQRLDVNPFGGWNPTSPSPSVSNPNQTCLEFYGNRNFSCLEDRLQPNRGDITEVANSAISTYDSLQASLTTRTLHTRLGGSYSMTAAYTWSHTIDNASEIFGPGVQFIQGSYVESLQSPETQATVEAITPFPQNSADLRAEKGNSAFDRRHRLGVSFLWGLPSPGERSLHVVFGGWTLAGIGTLQSGQPFTPLNGVPLGPCGDANGDGLLTNDRPNIGNPHAPVNSVALLADPSCINPALGYIDLSGNPVNPANAHFVQVPLGTDGGGNAGRNVLTGPWLAEADLAVHKDFSWGEGKRVLQFRWEVYDAFNRANPGFPLGNVFATDAQPTPGFAFSPRASAAGVTGNIPENAIDAYTLTAGGKPSFDFLSQRFMNTGNRRMQFSVHLTF
jgi:Carboxypeptidase regulatory-like domain